MDRIHLKAPAGLRAANRAAVLRLLRRHQQLSRAELARRSELSEGTVSRIVTELIRERLVGERGVEASTGGRPGMRLRVDPAHLRSIGVEIRDWETLVALGDAQGRILESHSFRTPADPAEVVEEAGRWCESLAAKLGPGQLEGIGVAARGVVNCETGVVEIGATAPWRDVPVAGPLRERLRMPVEIDNNVRAAALAEYELGNPDVRSKRCVLFIRVDDGVGAAFVLEGKVYRGPHVSTGEIGQMVVRDSPGRGRQDREGCLESLASNPVLCRLYSERNGGPWKGRGGDMNARARSICHEAMRGSEAAREAIAEACRYLGIGIANTVWALDVDAVILDGALTEAWPLAAAAIQEQFPPGEEFRNFRTLALRPCALEPDAALVGAVLLPFSHLFATGHRRVAAARTRTKSK